MSLMRRNSGIQTITVTEVVNRTSLGQVAENKHITQVFEEIQGEDLMLDPFVGMGRPGDSSLCGTTQHLRKWKQG